METSIGLDIGSSYQQFIFLVAVAASPILLFVWLDRENTQKYGKEKNGFGKGLLLFAFYVDLRPLISAMSYLSYLAQNSSDLHRSAWDGYYYEMILNTISFIGQIYVAILMHRKTKSFPTYFAYFNVLLICLPLLDAAMAAATLPDNYIREPFWWKFCVFTKFLYDSVTGIERIVLLIATIIYVRLSQRVSLSFQQK